MQRACPDRLSQRQQPYDAATAEHADPLREQPAAESIVQQLVIEQQFLVPVPVIQQFVIEQLVVEQFVVQRRLAEPRVVRAGHTGQPVVDGEPQRQPVPGVGGPPGLAGVKRGPDRRERR